APNDRRISYYPVFADELVAVVAPEHRWAGRSFVSAREMMAEHLILGPGPKAQAGLISKLLAAERVEPQSVTRMVATEGIREMAREGLGVGIVPRWAARTYLSTGLVRSVRITRGGLRRDWQAAVRSSAEKPAYLKDFVAIIAGSSDSTGAIP